MKGFVTVCQYTCFLVAKLIPMAIGAMNNRDAPTIGKALYVGQHIFNSSSHNKLLCHHALSGCCINKEAILDFFSLDRRIIKPLDCWISQNLSFSKLTYDRRTLSILREKVVRLRRLPIAW